MNNPVLVHLASGFEEIEAITIIDVLRRAELNVITISITGELSVTGAHSVTIKADQLFENTDYHNACMLILPGGMPGTNHLLAHEGLKNELTRFNSLKKPIGAICAAPIVLGSLNMLEGKDAVCYPGFEQQLSGANLVHSPFAVADNITTGKGVGTALAFSLEIVRQLKGATLADQLKAALVIE